MTEYVVSRYRRSKEKRSVYQCNVCSEEISEGSFTEQGTRAGAIKSAWLHAVQHYGTAKAIAGYSAVRIGGDKDQERAMRELLAPLFSPIVDLLRAELGAAPAVSSGIQDTLS